MTSFLADAIKRASGRSEYLSKAAARAASSKGSSGGASSVFAASAGGASGSSNSAANEQYRHFTGWQYVAIRAIAQRIASQSIKLGTMKGAKASTRFNARAASPIEYKSTPSWVKTTAGDAASSTLSLIEDHPIIQAFKFPNDMMPQWSLIYTTICNLELTGRNYWWITPRRDAGEGMPEIQIWPVPASWVKADHKGKFNSSFKVSPPGSAGAGFDVPGHEMVSFYLPDPSNPMMSVSPLQSQAQAITTDEAIQQAQRAGMENGLNPGLMIIAGRLPDSPAGIQGQRPVLQENQRKQLFAAIKGMYQGVARNKEPFIVDGLIEGIQPYTLTPMEMDFMNSGVQTKSRIMQAFGVNPMVVGEIQGSNRAAAAVAEDNFCQNCVNPLAELISQTMTMWLRANDAANSDIEVPEGSVFWIDPCRSHDADLTLQEWNAAATLGAVTIDEFRANVLKLEPLYNQPIPTGTPNPILLEVLGVETESMKKAAEIDDQKTQLELESSKLSVEQQRSGGTQDDEEQPTPGAKGKVPPKKPGKFKKELALVNGFGDAPILTKEVKATVWLKQQGQEESSLESAINQHLVKLSDKVVDGISAELMKSPWHAKESSAESLIDTAFNRDEWVGELKKSVKPQLTSAANRGAAAEYAMMELSRKQCDYLEKATATKPSIASGFKLPAKVTAAIDQHVLKSLSQPYWDDIHFVTRKIMLDVLKKSIKDGDSAATMTAKLKNVIRDKTRAKTIARTEATGALNAGRFAASQDLIKSGDVVGYEWATVGDDDVRETHTAMSTIKIKAGEQFTLPLKGGGTEEAPHPGYYGLSAENRCNCRCTAISITKYDARIRKAMGDFETKLLT